ncbi:MAG: glutathione S-transferase family protein [Pseudomonadota bacterium]
MITIYGRATSSNVQLVMWAAAELGIKVDRMDYGHVHGGTDTQEYRAMNPNGLVPTMRDGDLVMWESAAILRYLAAQYGSDAFWPAQTATRATIDMWAEWGKGLASGAFTGPVFWARVRTASTDRDHAALRVAVDRVDQLLEIAALQIGTNPFLCGDALTAADIPLGHILYRWFTMDIARRPNPTVEAYYDRLTQRNAYATHVMVPYDALRHPDA